jgi:hypothetical protein
VVESRVVLDGLVAVQQTFLAELFGQDVRSEHALCDVSTIQVVHAVSADSAVLLGVSLAAVVSA